MKNYFPYEDIIDLPPHISTKHPQASIQDRAARFSPFAAITGYEDMVNEAARVTDERIELDESLKRLLDEKLEKLRINLNTAPSVSITHFVADTQKTGGAYILTTGNVKRIDEYECSILLTDGKKIMIQDIIELELEIEIKMNK